MSRPGTKYADPVGCGHSPLADEIISALDACASVPEVNATAIHYADAVKRLKADPELRVRAIHVENMAAYKRRQLKRSQNVSR